MGQSSEDCQRNRPQLRRPKAGQQASPPFACENDEEGRVAGSWLVDFHVENDPKHKLRWGWVDKEAVSTSVFAITEEDLERLGLLVALSFDFARPHVGCCMSFIRSFDVDTRIATVHDKEIHLTVDLLREAFVLDQGFTPRPMQVRHVKIEDWFPERDVVGKRYFTRHCTRVQFRALFQLLGCILLARRAPRIVQGHLALYVKSKIERAAENYDWAEYILESVILEIGALQRHLLQARGNRIRLTFVGILLTHIIVHEGILHEEEVIRCHPPEALQARLDAISSVSIEGHEKEGSGDDVDPSKDEIERRMKELQDLDAMLAYRKALVEDVDAKLANKRAQVEDLERRVQLSLAQLNALRIPVHLHPVSRRVDPASVRRKTLIVDLNGVVH